MLGLGKSRHKWQWSAFGKHPVARDYFRLGAAGSVAVALESWIEAGFKNRQQGNGPAKNSYSWRFWVKGPKKERLVCGVGRDSSTAEIP